MGERTGIAWTRSTGNPWIGCTEVSPGCDSCYARVLDERHRYGGATHWGAGVPRHERLEALAAAARGWNKKAGVEKTTGAFASERDAWAGAPGFWPVFPSMCDPFDNEVPDEWHRKFWALISMTPNLTWLLLTKRIGNAERYVREFADRSVFPSPNVWIGASVVNQKEADRDLPKLIETQAAKRFVSYEPALGPVDFTEWLGKQVCCGNAQQIGGGFDEPPEFDCCREGVPAIDQLIVGGESDQGKLRARPFDIEWARAARDQCRASGVRFFMKQAGSAPIWHGVSVVADNRYPWPSGTRKDDLGEGFFRVKLKTRGGDEPLEWPDDLRVQEFP